MGCMVLGEVGVEGMERVVGEGLVEMMEIEVYLV